MQVIGKRPTRGIQMVAAVLTAGAALAFGAGADGVPTAAAATTNFDDDTCRKLAEEGRDLEKSGVAELLARQPEDVQAKDGKAAIERVRRYLSVREGLLFHCRPGVENEVLAKIRRPETRLRMPPLPTRGPLQSAVTPRKPETSPVKRANAKPAAPQDASVPLPVQRKEPFRFPKSSNDS